MASLFHLLAILSVFAVNGEVSFAHDENSDMVFFPAGEFLMGSPNGVGQRDEHPQRRVYLDSFYLDRYEVTGQGFEEYLEAHPNRHPTITGWFDRKARPGMEKRPVIGLTWKRCSNYCAWKGKRLPTEAEWERAAAGLTQRVYPWGNDPPDPSRANFSKCCFIRKGEILEEVGTYELGKTPEGVYDMAGNIAEWVYDWYGKDYYKHSEYKNPRGPEKGKYHTIRGGAWNSPSIFLKSADRYGSDDAHLFYGIGCRCAKSARPNAKNQALKDK